MWFWQFGFRLGFFFVYFAIDEGPLPLDSKERYLQNRIEPPDSILGNGDLDLRLTQGKLFDD